VTVSRERKGVLAQPGGTTGTSFGGGVAVTFAQSARCFPRSRLPAKLAMFLLSLTNPLNSGIAANGGVGGIDHDHFVVFVSGVFSNPVRVEHAERPDLTAHALLGNGLEGALELHLVDAMVGGLAVGAALGDGLLTGTAADAHAVNDESLLGAVSQASGLFDPGRLRSAMDSRELPVLPSSDAKKKAHHVTLLLPPQLVDVFVRPHCSKTYLSLKMLSFNVEKKI